MTENDVDSFMATYHLNDEYHVYLWLVTGNRSIVNLILYRKQIFCHLSFKMIRIIW